MNFHENCLFLNSVMEITHNVETEWLILSKSSLLKSIYSDYL